MKRTKLKPKRDSLIALMEKCANNLEACVDFFNTLSIKQNLYVRNAVAHFIIPLIVGMSYNVKNICINVAY